MPDGLSGWELAKEFHSIKPNLKVIYMSGYNAEMTTGKPDLEKPVCFLEKPFSPQKLTEVVRSRLDNETSFMGPVLSESDRQRRVA